MRTVALSTVVLFLISIGSQAAVAATTHCAGGRISVEAEDSDLAVQVCAVADRARALLNQCHLFQSAPILLLIGPHEQSMTHGCMGNYDAGNGTVLLKDPDTLQGMLTEQDFWGRIPVDRLFQSLVVHELAHAFLQQTADSKALCVADHEYIAYTMQLSWLDASERAGLTGTEHPAADPDVAYLNDFIALAAPDVFVKTAWSHFSLPENGCGFVRRIIGGQETLYRDPS